MKPHSYYSRTADSVREVRVMVVNETGTADSVLTLNRADVVAEFFLKHVSKASWFDPDKECVVVLLLDRKNHLKGWNLVSLGSLTSSLIHSREVFRPAVAGAASAVLVAHNHPSGDPSPSAADLQVTRKLREAGELLDIPVHDHVVVGNAACDPLGRGYYSFRDAGVI